MTAFHAVFIDETGQGEFGATIEAPDRETAWDLAAEYYPESRCIQLESPEDSAERERQTYFAAMYDDGRPDYDDEDEEF